MAPDSTTFGVAVNARHPEQVYFCTRRGQVFGTHDGGTTWSEHRLPESAMNVIAVCLGAAMSTLSHMERAAFVLRHFEEHSIEEISRALVLKANAAKHSVLRTACIRAKRALAGCAVLSR